MIKRVLSFALVLAVCLCSLLPVLADGNAEEQSLEDILYIIPDSDVRELTVQELWGYTYETLGFIRNEILARHGYAFHGIKFYNYFDAKPWYRAGGYTGMDMLSNVERRNHTLVRTVEKAMDSNAGSRRGAIDIADIIAAQNALGGFGDMLKFGNEYGNGDGKTYPEEEAERKKQQELEARMNSAQPYYIYTTQYIIPDSNSRLLTEGELWGYTRETLRYIRNEMLARYGYIFGDNKFGRYFKTKAWYKEGGYSDDLPTQLEWKNINLVRSVEAAMDQMGTENPQGLDIMTIISHQAQGICPGGY